MRMRDTRRPLALLRAVVRHGLYCARFPARMESVPRRSLEIELVKLIGQVPPGTVLDVGASDAPYRRLLPARHYVSVDIAVGRGVDIVSDLHDLACASGCVDTVVATEVLEHCRDPRGAVAEMHRVLKPSGVCILTTRFIHPYHPTPRDYYRFTRDGLAELFGPFNGVDIVHHGNTLQSIWALLSATRLRPWLNLLNPLVARITSARTPNPSGFLVYAVK
jgi:SAM-dependent methyltransferase